MKKSSPTILNKSYLYKLFRGANKLSRLSVYSLLNFFCFESFQKSEVNLIRATGGYCSVEAASGGNLDLFYSYDWDVQWQLRAYYFEVVVSSGVFIDGCMQTESILSRQNWLANMKASVFLRYRSFQGIFYTTLNIYLDLLKNLFRNSFPNFMTL